MLWHLVTAVISVSAGVIGMGMFCGRKHMTTLSERDRARIDYATERRKRLEAEQARDEIDITTLSERDRARIDYATERRKRLEAEQARDEIDIACKHWMSENTQLHARLKEAEQAHTDLADKHNCTNARIENVITLIDSIPHRKGKETRIKAMLLGGAA